MKQRTKIIFLVYSALVIFMSSACIYMSHMIKSRYQDTSSEINIYKNVYITNIEDNTITANMYGNIKKFNSGKIAEDVTGCLCDITVENGKCCQFHKTALKLKVMVLLSWMRTLLCMKKKTH